MSRERSRQSAQPDGPAAPGRRLPGLLLVLGLAAGIVGSAYLGIRGAPPIVDEYVHSDQIRRFSNGDFSPDPELAMVPGYHFAFAGIARLLGGTDPDTLRFAGACLSVLCVVLFFLICRELRSAMPVARSLQFLLLPVLFPYFVMVYTDAFSMLAVLLCFYCSLKKRPAAAGLSGLLALATRQTSVAWVGMIFLMGYHADNGSNLSWRAVAGHARKYWAFVLLFLLFIVFVVYNGGVALGGAEPQQPRDSQQTVFQLNNVFSLLIVFCIVYLPFIAAEFPRTIRAIRRPAVQFALAACFLAYLFSFRDMHPLNMECNFILIRNYPLSWIHGSLLPRLLFFLPVALSVLFLASGEERSVPLLLVYAVSLALLSATYLVEPRYYIPTLAFYGLFRAPRGPIAEPVQTAYLAAVSGALLSVDILYGSIL